MRIFLLDKIGSGVFAWNNVSLLMVPLLQLVAVFVLFFFSNKFCAYCRLCAAVEKPFCEPKFTHQIARPPFTATKLITFPPRFFWAGASVFDTIAKTQHLSLISCFSCCLVVALFLFLSFFRLFDSFKFQSRWLHLQSVEHTNSLPIETPSFSKLCYCLRTHSVNYIAQRHISAK